MDLNIHVLDRRDAQTGEDAFLHQNKVTQHVVELIGTFLLAIYINQKYDFLEIREDNSI